MSKQYPGGIISKTPVTPSGAYETSTASGIWTLDQQAYWAKLGQWPTAGNSAPDAQFNYVTMLLHGDGTNGAQNNTFLDSSTNNFTITRNGNTTQGSFSPYGSNWGNYFDGSSYLSLATATALGTGNVTVELWFYPTDISATYQNLYEGRSAAATNTGLGVFQYGQTIEIYGNGLKVSSAASAFTANTWTHFAVVRTSGTCQIYINGVASGSSASYSDNFTSTTRRIGTNAANANAYTGYISNLREVTSALYSGTFTPSTTALTAVSGTTLLTCQSNRFIDNSSNAYAITVNSSPSVQRFNPFGASTAYSTSVIGGSGYFDGDGDYITVPDNSAFTLGTSNFTIEFSVYPLSGGGTSPIIFEHGQNGDWGAWIFQWISQSNLYFYAASSAGAGSYNVCNQSLGTLVPNEWAHICVTRSGNTFTGYKNGISVFTSTSALGIQDQTAPVTIGRHYNSSAQDFKGYVTDARIVVGSVVTPPTGGPTSPLTAVSNTALLTNMTNGAIYDNAMMNDLETVGNAQISTSVVKFGTGSMAFDGTGDYLTRPYTDLLQFGSGNFTIECWAYLTASNSSNFIIGNARNSDGSGGWLFFVDTNRYLGFYFTANGTYGTGGYYLSSSQISFNTWTHIAATRNGSSFYLFINGVLVATNTSSTAIYNSTRVITIASDFAGSSDASWTGYIDDLRITKGYARYTTTFTPPTAAFPNIGPT